MMRTLLLAGECEVLGAPFENHCALFTQRQRLRPPGASGYLLQDRPVEGLRMWWLPQWPPGRISVPESSE
jgi:hypothetical protein